MQTQTCFTGSGVRSAVKFVEIEEARPRRSFMLKTMFIRRPANHGGKLPGTSPDIAILLRG